MSKKKPKINLANVEDNLSDVMDALSGTTSVTEIPTKSATNVPISQTTESEASPKESGRAVTKSSSRKKPVASATPQTKPPLNTTGGGLTSEELDWLFTSSPREHGTTQVRVSKRTKDAVYLLAQHHGGIPGGQLFDNIITYFLTNNIKELKKIVKRDPLNQF